MKAFSSITTSSFRSELMPGSPLVKSTQVNLDPSRPYIRSAGDRLMANMCGNQYSTKHPAAWDQPCRLHTSTNTSTPVITSPLPVSSFLFTFVFFSDVLVCLNEVLLVCIRREADGFIHGHGQSSQHLKISQSGPLSPPLRLGDVRLVCLCVYTLVCVCVYSWVWVSTAPLASKHAQTSCSKQ